MAKVTGVDVLLKVKNGSTYVPVGGQKGASLKRSASTIDVTDKNSDGWAESMAGVKSWSLDCDAFVVLGDVTLELLHTAFDKRTAMEIELRVGADDDSNGYTYTGSVVIVDFPEDYPQDDAVSISISLQGASPLVRVSGTVTPPTAVTATIASPSTNGFDITLSPAVTGLTSSNLTIKSQSGAVITPTNITTSNSGATYHVACTLTSGKVATVEINKAGYDFGYTLFVVVA